MGGLWSWVVSEWRRNWRSLAGLTVLVAFGGAITIAALAGARRADTAFDRFLDKTSAAIDVTSAGTTDNLAVYDGARDLAADMAAVPGVEGVRPVTWMGVAAEAHGVVLPAFATAIGPGVGDRPPVGAIVLRGRMPEPTQPGEIALNEVGVDVLGADVGDRVVLNSLASDQVTTFVNAGDEAFRGPRVEAEVVGVVRTAEDVSDVSEPAVFLSDGFRATYLDDVAHCDCSFWVRTAPNAVAAVSAALPSTFGAYPLAVQEVDSVLRARVERAVGLEVGALRIAVLIAAVASLLVISQAITRHIGTGRDSAVTLAALGTTRAAMVRSWTVILSPVAVVGALGAALGAWLLSPIFPRGLAHKAEPNPGPHLDAAAVLGGAAAVLVTVLAVASACAFASVRRNLRGARRAGASQRRFGVAVDPTLALGASLAMDPGRDRARLGALTAVAGLALAIAGAVAVSLIDVSTSDVLATPAAYGADWDLVMPEQPRDPDAVITATAAERVEALAINMQVAGNEFVATGRSGTGLVSPQAFDSVVGSIEPFLARGRPATNSDDIVLGAAIADRLGVDVGDEITIDSSDQGRQRYVVSGIGALDDGDETDMAAVVTVDGLQRLQSFDRLSISGAMIRTGDIDDGARRRLEQLGWAPVTPPSRVASLEEIGSVPRLLAIALAVLGMGGLVHTLLLASRRRRHDLAVARALGFTRGQVASTVRWQGVLTTAAGVIVGLPLGVLVGRVVWKRVAEGVGAVDLVSIPWTVMLIVPLATLVAVFGLASLVGHRTAGLNPARTLRGE
jgi:ABC-type lipoprotein release transport system permease subunit